MNQIKIGNYITKKRKEKNLTQEKLAEKIGVSNKTISKWETGKSMPDYATIPLLCEELGISVSELMDAEDNEPKSIRVYDEEQILDLVKTTQDIKKQNEKNLLGVVIFVLGLGMAVIAIYIYIDLGDILETKAMYALSMGTIITGLIVILKSAHSRNEK